MRLLKQRGLLFFQLVAIFLIGVHTLKWSIAWAANETDVLQKSYPYVVIDQRLQDVLSEFGRNLGIKLEMTDKVKGVVQVRMEPDETAESFLLRVAETHDLVWYLDQNTLFVSTKNENQTKTVSAMYLDPKWRQEIAKKWSEKGKGVNVSLDEHSGNLVVNGPSSFYERMASFVATFHRPQERREGMSITVFRRGSGGQQVIVPR